MGPPEPLMGLFGKTGMHFNEVFVDTYGIVHGFLRVILLMTIAISLPWRIHGELRSYETGRNTGKEKRGTCTDYGHAAVRLRGGERNKGGRTGTPILCLSANISVRLSVFKWSPLRQEPEAPLNIATSRDCLLATPHSSRSRGSAFHSRREPGDAKARDYRAAWCVQQVIAAGSSFFSSKPSVYRD